jgi:hypothetical protein
MHEALFPGWLGTIHLQTPPSKESMVLALVVMAVLAALIALSPVRYFNTLGLGIRKVHLSPRAVLIFRMLGISIALGALWKILVVLGIW